MTIVAKIIDIEITIAANVLLDIDLFFGSESISVFLIISRDGTTKFLRIIFYS